MSLMRHRYLLAFLSAAAILALVGVAIMLGTQRYRQDASAVLHTMEVLGTMQAAHASLLHAVASQRSYLLTDDPTYRDLYVSARESAGTRLSALKPLLADNPAQAGRARELAGLVERRRQSAPC